MSEFRDVDDARRLLQEARSRTGFGGLVDAGLVLDALDRADRGGQPVTAPAGYVIGRDLGDGRIEFWEANPDRTVPAHPGEDAAVAELPGEEWAVYALTEVQP